MVETIKYVDKIVPQINMNKNQAAIDNNINSMFIGDDWKETGKWNKIEQELSVIGTEGVKVIYFLYTKYILRLSAIL